MKVGLCGLGKRLGYLEGVFRRAMPDFDVIAYADPAPAGATDMDTGRFERLRGYAELEHMLDREALDLVMLGSPNVLHCDQLCMLLEAGIRTFCEKPLVVSEEQTFRLLRNIEGRDPDRILVGLVLRYAPLYSDLTRLVDAGTLGNIVSIEASEHIPPAHGAFLFRDWRRKADLSGGLLLEKCCHDIDMYSALVQSRPQQVVSFGGCSVFSGEMRHLNEQGVYHRRASHWRSADSPFSGDADIVDHQVALIQYASGTRLAFHVNVHTPDPFRRFCVIGTDGMAEGDFVRGYMQAHRAVSGECVFDTCYPHDGVSKHYGAEAKMAEEIVRHLEHGAPLPVSVFDALEVGLTAMKIDESRQSGQVVDLAGLWSRFDAAVAKSTRVASPAESSD